jgi:DNA replication protein DnaC
VTSYDTESSCYIERDLEVALYESADPVVIRKSMIRNAGFPKRQIDARMGWIPEKASHYAPLTDYMTRVIEHEDCGRGMIISGHLGGGKTSCSCLIAKRYAAHGATTLFVTAPRLGEAIARPRTKKCPRGEDLELAARVAQILVLDEFGSEDPSWAKIASGLEDLIRYRCDNRRVTIITTNLGRKHWPPFLESMANRKESFVDLEVVDTDGHR